MRHLTLIACFIVAACGPTEADMERVAQVTCAVVAETRNMDAALRVKSVNDARQELGLGPFLEGDDQIVLSIKYGICELLVLDRGWEDELVERMIAESQRLLDEAQRKVDLESERLATLRQTVVEQGYAAGKDTELRDGITYLTGDVSPFTGLVQTFHDNSILKMRQSYENGKPHGLKEVFYEDGTIRWRGPYENGKNEWSESFDEDGNVKYSTRQ